MPFTFLDSDKAVTKAVRRIARERLSAATLLTVDPSPSRAELIHELRKNVKKTRALLRLVRPNFVHFRRESRTLRDAARLISDLRDADVLAQNFDKIAARSSLPQADLTQLKARILPARGTLPDGDAQLQAHCKVVARVERGAKSWKIAGDGFDALEGGLERTWNDARDAMRRAERDSSGEALHEWRKRVKDHWYHARLLAPIWPEMMDHHIAIANGLGETLGDARDLARLSEALESESDGDEVRMLAKEEADALLATARTTAAHFFAEPADCLSRRWKGWWRVWRAR